MSDYEKGLYDALTGKTEVLVSDKTHSKLDHEAINADIAIDDIQACELGLVNLIVRQK